MRTLRQVSIKDLVVIYRFFSHNWAGAQNNDYKNHIKTQPN